ncbi:hypothetical protein [Vibrio sp. NH-UV-68]|uniref:hypothetical protein n=1 Tax=unclassified Vibrio TaxID=2614977 RepID=UPI0036F3F7E3
MHVSLLLIISTLKLVLSLKKYVAYLEVGAAVAAACYISVYHYETEKIDEQLETMSHSLNSNRSSVARLEQQDANSMMFVLARLKAEDKLSGIVAEKLSFNHLL